MQIIYEGKDITEAVEVRKADIIDNAGGIADSIELHFDDPKKMWSQWKPKKNDTIKIIHEGFQSGVMFVDELEQQRGLFIIRALSIPQEAKTENTKAWENVRFLEFAGELANKYGFCLETYGIQNHLYERVDQLETADFKFLAVRCMLEGYTLKLTDKKVVVYSEQYMEGQPAQKTIDITDFDGKYRFIQKSTGIYGSCRVSYGRIQTEFTPAVGPTGPVLKYSDILVFSIGEADRFAKNLLRYHNKNEYTGQCTVRIDSGIAAGGNIAITGVGMADGKYFCKQVIHRLVEGKTTLRLRKPLEAY